MRGLQLQRVGERTGEEGLLPYVGLHHVSLIVLTWLVAMWLGDADTQKEKSGTRQYGYVREQVGLQGKPFREDNPKRILPNERSVFPTGENYFH